MFGVRLDIVRRSAALRGRFEVLPRRWVVERSFAWLAHARRLAKDYETLPATRAAFIKITEVHRWVKLLC
jgi:transposase